jgi:hypothetical protein
VSAVEPPDPTATAPATPPRLTGIEAAKVHATFGLAVCLCAVAFWFELHRALGGNGLSWAYVFEWPLFAAFAAYMWWTVLHGGRRERRPPKPATVKPEHVAMLAAWQAHLRQMAEDEATGADPSGVTEPPPPT